MKLPTGRDDLTTIAAGAYHTLAAVFSPLVQYPVEVSQDLLLIYNTNSADSAFVKDYYLAHRPMVSEANVLGVGCTNAEIITSSTLTNEILNPYWAWLEANPTKRPQYLVLFPDIPSRVHDPATRPSVQVQLHEKTPGHAPFVTSINLATTNDCVAYIDKLAWCGSNYSPGQIVLSASKGGYGNTKYTVDNVRHWPYSGSAAVAGATNGLVSADVATSEIAYIGGVENCVQWITNVYEGATNIYCGAIEILPHITNATDVAGYISWGFQSSLNSDYAVNGLINWSGNSKWWII